MGIQRAPLATTSHYKCCHKAAHPSSGHGKQGFNHLLKGNMINTTTVLAARDTLVSAGKMVGMELGSLLKFKPWGAVNFVKGANGALAFLGVAIEAWDSWEQYKREEAFRKSIAKMVEDFEMQRKELIGRI